MSEPGCWVSTRELEERTGLEISGRLEIVGIEDELWHRVGEDQWERYPEATPLPGEEHV